MLRSEQSRLTQIVGQEPQDHELSVAGLLESYDKHTITRKQRQSVNNCNVAVNIHDS